MSAGPATVRSFEDTTGLTFVGAAATTTCGNTTPFAYQPRHGTADGISVDETPPSNVYSEGPGFRETRTVETDDENTTGGVTKHLAWFGHRDSYVAGPGGGCPTRVRLTPSQPFQRGALWRQQEAFVLRGFDTEFTWQVSKHSRDCLQVKDAAFDGNLYSSCAVHGADGFAFVVHLDPNRTHAIGAGGGGLGYGGIHNAIAVEFDTSYNPELGDSAPLDHVQVQARGSDPLTSDDASRISGVVYADVADGAVHRARVAYFPSVQASFLPSFTAAAPLRPFLRDEGEGRRLGTLAVWIDAPPLREAAGNSSLAYPSPTLALPINLGAAVIAPRSAAVVGFTSATGRRFERHDILSWSFCEQAGCQALASSSAAGEGPETDDVSASSAAGLDYHRESNV